MDTPDLPDHFGRYEVKSKLGEGGFAIVYRARDPMLGREVALKALLPALCADGDIRRRFLAEAHAIAPLHHPNIVTIFDVGEANDRPFFTMELVEGHSLAQIVATYGTLSYESVAAILGGLAAAVDYIHAAGLVHRDIKASNVLVEPSGRVALMDFGIARSIDRSRHTRSGVVLGTPEAMAPEQIRGEPVGPATDTYALGVLAYQLLAGRAPFTGDIWTVLYAQVNQEPPPLSDFCPGLPVCTYRAVHAALAKDPLQRPLTAGLFAAQFAGNAPQALDSPSVDTNDTGLSPTVSIEDPSLSWQLPPTERTAQAVGAGAPTEMPLVPHGHASPVTERTPSSPTVPRPAGTVRSTRWLWLLSSSILAAVVMLMVFMQLRTMSSTRPPAIEKVPNDFSASASPIVNIVSPETLPVVSNLRVLNNVFDQRETEFEAGETVAICFGLTASALVKPIYAVATERLEPPSGPDDQMIVARSEQLTQQSLGSCYPMRVISPPLASGPHWVWVLHGSEVIGRGGFHNVTSRPGLDPTATATASALPPVVPVAITSLGCLPANVIVGELVRCTPTMDGRATSTTWNAAGGSPSDSRQASFNVAFNAPGPHRISLDVCNPGGCTAASQLITVNVAVPSPAPTLASAAHPLTPEPTAPVSTAQPPVINALGCSPLQVETGQSITCSPNIRGTVASYAWSASGGSPGSGSNHNFTVTFATEGVHTVRLTACSGSACASSVQSVTASAPPPVAPSITSLRCDPTNAQTGQRVTCNSLTSGSITSTAWSAPLGSPSSGSGANFATAFTGTGFTTITLTACNGPACVSRSQEITLVAAVMVVTVDATSTGVRTGVFVRRGETVSITATGSWCSGGIKAPGVASCGDPGGIRPPNQPESAGSPLQGASIGLLIGKVGPSVFAIGGGSQVVIENDGELILLMNDLQGTYGDNSGSITVSIRR